MLSQDIFRRMEPDLNLVEELAKTREQDRFKGFQDKSSEICDTHLDYVARGSYR
jgi:hypothetical protein